MRTFGHFCLGLFLVTHTALGVVSVPNLPAQGVLGPDNRAAIDPNVDYERFSGRVTDKDDDSRIFKVGLGRV